MNKRTEQSRLIEKEKQLYREVEQLRTRLYLHDTSLIFEFFSAFYFAFQDIKGLFFKKHPVSKKQFFASLERKKKALLLLEKTPYAWLLFILRSIKYMIPPRQTNKKPMGGGKSTKASYVVLGTTSANDLQSRSVQLARTLALKNTVLYVEGVFDEGIKPGIRIVESTDKFTAVRLTAKRQFHLSYQKQTKKELSFLKDSYKRIYAFTKEYINEIIYVHHSFWDTVLPLKKNTFVFDYAEDFAHNHHAAAHIIKSEGNLLKKALRITTPFQDKKKQPRHLLVKHGLDLSHFKDAGKTIQTCDVGLCWIKKPVIGYIGALDERIDEELIGKIAHTFKTASVVLVGNTDYRPAIAVAEAYPNIFPVGKQPYAKLPLFLQSFDILIAPYKNNKASRIAHPELPMYLASGKPVICSATSTPGVAKAHFIYSPQSHTEWILMIEEALKEKKRSPKKYARIRAAKKLGWKVPQELGIKH